jgi:hypothetical protein
MSSGKFAIPPLQDNIQVMIGILRFARGLQRDVVYSG